LGRIRPATPQGDSGRTYRLEPPPRTLARFATERRARLSGEPFLFSSVKLRALSPLARLALERVDSRDGRRPRSVFSRARVAFEAACLLSRLHSDFFGFFRDRRVFARAPRRISSLRNCSALVAMMALSSSVVG